MKVVGLVSCYREGRLVRKAIESLQVPGIDAVYAFEGQAGPPISAECPESDIPETISPLDGALVTGLWQTDAAKRTVMVKHVQNKHPDERVWGVWVDGDEVLMNGEYLRDILQALDWRDQEIAGWPIRLVELDGTVATVRAKVIRIDLIANYVVSSSGIRFKTGVTQAEGNLPMRLADWWIPERMAALEQGNMVLSPPLPGEPHLLHRSSLRHPARVGLRMHEQEAVELGKLGVKIPH